MPDRLSSGSAGPCCTAARPSGQGWRPNAPPGRGSYGGRSGSFWSALVTTTGPTWRTCHAGCPADLLAGDLKVRTLAQDGSLSCADSLAGAIRSARFVGGTGGGFVSRRTLIG